jgi:Ni,Fe-hydrogenase I large subunit
MAFENSFRTSGGSEVPRRMTQHWVKSRRTKCQYTQIIGGTPQNAGNYLAKRGQDEKLHESRIPHGFE